MLLEILSRIEHGSGIEQGDAEAEVGEDLDGGAAAGARADDGHVEYLGGTYDLQHLRRGPVLNITSGDARIGMSSYQRDVPGRSGSQPQMGAQRVRRDWIVVGRRAGFRAPVKRSEKQNCQHAVCIRRLIN